MFPNRHLPKNAAKMLESLEFVECEHSVETAELFQVKKPQAAIARSTALGYPRRRGSRCFLTKDQSVSKEMELQKIVVCGVPEHFNLPWHLAIENGLFAKHGVLVLAPTHI
jgi:ABC-type nitrate/sulfonate/bicarbonate transport system substrate-binding protein